MQMEEEGEEHETEYYDMFHTLLLLPLLGCHMPLPHLPLPSSLTACIAPSTKESLSQDDDDDDLDISSLWARGPTMHPPRSDKTIFFW